MMKQSAPVEINCNSRSFVKHIFTKTKHTHIIFISVACLKTTCDIDMMKSNSASSVQLHCYLLRP